MRGILREVRNARRWFSEFKISVTDPQGRLLSEQTVKASRFGTFDSTLVLPAAAVSGQYVIAAHQDRKGLEPLHFQGAFEVRSFQLEKIKLSFEFPRRVWFRGETIVATLESAFTGGSRWRAASCAASSRTAAAKPSRPMPRERPGCRSTPRACAPERPSGSPSRSMART